MGGGVWIGPSTLVVALGGRKRRDKFSRFQVQSDCMYPYLQFGLLGFYFYVTLFCSTLLCSALSCRAVS